MSTVQCRAGCGACCTAPSISTPLPKMPGGKPAGQPCAHLSSTMQCEIFGQPERPPVCSGLQPSAEMCGTSREYAILWLTAMEHQTAPDWHAVPA